MKRECKKCAYSHSVIKNYEGQNEYLNICDFEGKSEQFSEDHVCHWHPHKFEHVKKCKNCEKAKKLALSDFNYTCRAEKEAHCYYGEHLCHIEDCYIEKQG